MPEDRKLKSPLPDDIVVGRNLRLLRKTAGIPAEDLARAIGIGRQQLEEYESGTSRIGASLMFTLSSILEVPVSDFFEGLDSDHIARFFPTDTEQETAELINLFRRISDRNLKTALLMLLRS